MKGESFLKNIDRLPAMKYTFHKIAIAFKYGIQSDRGDIFGEIIYGKRKSIISEKTAR